MTRSEFRVLNKPHCCKEPRQTDRDEPVGKASARAFNRMGTYLPDALVEPSFGDALPYLITCQINRLPKPERAVCPCPFCNWWVNPNVLELQLRSDNQRGFFLPLLARFRYQSEGRSNHQLKQEGIWLNRVERLFKISGDR